MDEFPLDHRPTHIAILSLMVGQKDESLYSIKVSVEMQINGCMPTTGHLVV